MTLTINSKFIRCECEENTNGSKPAGYTALVLEPGKHVATIEGNFELANPADHFGADMAIIDGHAWALRDVLALAKRGDNGFRVIE